MGDREFIAKDVYKFIEQFDDHGDFTEFAKVKLELAKRELNDIHLDNLSRGLGIRNEKYEIISFWKRKKGRAATIEVLRRHFEDYREPDSERQPERAPGPNRTVEMNQLALQDDFKNAGIRANPQADFAVATRLANLRIDDDRQNANGAENISRARQNANGAGNINRAAAPISDSLQPEAAVNMPVEVEEDEDSSEQPDLR